MRTHRTHRPVDPTVRASGFVSLMHRITNPVFLLVGFSDHQQPHVLIRVVDEGMANPGTRRERHRVTGLERMQMTVEPHIRRALYDEGEFLFGTFRMRIRGSTSRRHAHMVNADALKSKLPGKRRTDGK